MMGAILKESAAMMIAEFDKRNATPAVTASASTTDKDTAKATDKDAAAAANISFDEWAEFFQRLQIPDEKLEEILNQFA